uniref:Uncharacterized protein n=1 Tax=Dulem virus 40 TaxID=3145758 RepID=A0AAU8AUN8_9CAUD
MEISTTDLRARSSPTCRTLLRYTRHSLNPSTDGADN